MKSIHILTFLKNESFRAFHKFSKKYSNIIQFLITTSLSLSRWTKSKQAHYTIHLEYLNRHASSHVLVKFQEIVDIFSQSMHDLLHYNFTNFGIIHLLLPSKLKNLSTRAFERIKFVILLFQSQVLVQIYLGLTYY